MTTKQNVAIIGSGDWATAIASVVANNVKDLPEFEERVNMYVYEEEYLGVSLVDWINNKHVNEKYLKNFILPGNLYAVSDLAEAVKGADFLIFAIPRFFIFSCCKTLLGKMKANTMVIVLARQLEHMPRGGFSFTSQIFMKNLKMPCSVFNGSNLVTQIVNKYYCEIIVASQDPVVGNIWCTLLQNDMIKTSYTNDVIGVELCIGLKNVISIAAGLCDGLHCNANYKPAVVRLGCLDMIRFTDTFFPGCKLATFFKSCGIPDLILTCYGSRGRRLGEVLVEKRKPIPRLEEEFLDGQVVPGTKLAKDIHLMLKNKGIEDKFPIFMSVYKIISFRESADYLLENILNASSDICHPNTLKPL